MGIDIITRFGLIASLMNISITTYGKTLVALAAVVMLATPTVFAQAADFDMGGDFGSYTDSIDYSYPASYDYGSDFGSYTDSIDYTYPVSSDYGSYTDSIDYYSTPSYDYSSYGTASYGVGSWGWGGGSWGGSSGYSSSVSSVYAPTNTCTATNSCNSYWNSDDHSVVNIQNSTPSYPVYYSQPSYNYSGCGSIYGAGCITQPTVSYTATPYVSLTAVPYTGLDLGPGGEALYWSFLVLWCFAAAYLIAVKKVQNKVLAALNSFFYGSPKSEIAAAAHAPASDSFARSAPVTTSGIDSFIQAQINRSRA